MTAETARQALPVELDLRHAEPSFAEQIRRNPGCDTIVNCYQCGICTGTCPVSEMDERFSPAWIIQWVRMGLRRTVLQSPLIWYCLQCHRCSFHCPQGVRFADIDAALRALAMEEGFISSEQVETIHSLEQQLKQARLKLLDRFFEQGIGPAFSLNAPEPEIASAAGPALSESSQPPAAAGLAADSATASREPATLRPAAPGSSQTERSSPPAGAEGDWDQDLNDDNGIDWEASSDDDSGDESW